MWKKRFARSTRCDLTQDAGEGGDTELHTDAAPFAPLAAKPADYTDGRKLGEWKSKYSQDARNCINTEACVLACALVVSAILSAVFLALAGQSIQIPIHFLAESGAPTPTFNINFRLPMLFAVGCLGGATFSIKWLVHSAAKSKWHLDRRYWRYFVPLIGGVYACVVLTLLDGGMIGDHLAGAPRPVPLAAAFAFLVGYFSDGVSGLLSNIANAVFGTLEKK
jgi:hypothetical protein